MAGASSRKSTSTVLLLVTRSSCHFDAKVMQVMETNEYKEAPDLEKDPSVTS